MSRVWTKKQRLAIDTHGKNLLVSAAAGSGKTATLTERILRRLTDPESDASIDRMLIVTFTRMSAADLKRKISEAISERIAEDPSDRRLSHQLVLLENAHVSTIDSFYMEIVRSGFSRLGIPSDFRIADEGEGALLSRGVMENIIERHYDAHTTEDAEFLTFIENFTTAKQSDTLADVFLTLRTRLCSRAEGKEAVLALSEEMKEAAERDFFESRQGGIIRSYMQSAAEGYYKAISHACDVISADGEASGPYLPSFAHDKAFLGELTEMLRDASYSQVKEKLLSYNKINLSALKKSAQTDEILQCKAIRAEAIKFIDSAAEKYFRSEPDEIADMQRKTSDVLAFLYGIFTEFEEEALAEKIRRRAFGFDDIRRFALRLLSDENGEPSDIALSYRDKFDEIYVDEYQDVDAVQDKIFSLISRPANRFMVGDIKQSIYSFRGADPTLFADYKRSFPPIESGENDRNALIFMSNNFRCDKSIIDFTNEIFTFLFGNCGKSIDYSTEDNLIFSKPTPEGEAPTPTRVALTLITGDKSADEGDDEELEPEPEKSPESSLSPEAVWIANEIKRLVKNEKKADGSPIELGDIAIIMRSTGSSSELVRALDSAGIPCTDNSKQDLFETPDVLLMLSLLGVIDNPHKDIPLAATLYSPLFSYTMDELILIRRSADDSHSLFEALREYENTDSPRRETISKNKYFLEKLALYRDKALYLPIDKLLGFILSDLSVYALERDGTQNVTRLYEMARRFESGSFKGLNNFLAYVNELIENKKIPSLTGEDGRAGSVRLITAHKSKGLEFPVCFICGTQKKFNTDDIKLNLLYHPDAGIALRLAAESGMARINTPMREAVALCVLSSMAEEEMRVLYVALTRARERLYITAASKSKYAKLREKAALLSSFPSEFRIRQCNSYLSMILAALYPGEGNESYALNVIEADDESCTRLDASPLSRGESTGASDEITDGQVKKIKERINFVYPYEHLNKIPSKLSVSTLSPTVIDDIYDSAAVLEEPSDFKIAEIEDYFNQRSRPSGAERGTATHLFLQFCDFERTQSYGVEAELERLTEKKFISKETSALINVNQLKSFFSSELYHSIRSARRIWREQRFNILLPASDFTSEPALSEKLDEEKILVQGVIDLVFEDSEGKIILCDYKTDYLTPEELKDDTLAASKLSARHSRQLSYYAMACAELFGRAPDKILIYSLPLGKTVEIEI